MNKRTGYALPILLALATFWMVVSGGSARAGEDTGAIDQVRRDFNTAFTAGNAEAVGQLIDRDGVWLPPGRPTVVGKENIVRLYVERFAQDRSRFELKAGDIQVADGLAVLNGDFSRVDTPRGGGMAKPVSGHYLLVLKKQPEGGWRIVRDIWNETVAGEGK